MSEYGSTPPPPPPPPPGGGGYGAPPPGGAYGAPPPAGGGAVEHPKGTMILVLGIVGVVCCSPVGIVAFFMANTALKEIDANPAAYSNRQIVFVGKILGIVAMVLLALSLVYFLFMGGMVALTGLSTSP